MDYSLHGLTPRPYAASCDSLKPKRVSTSFAEMNHRSKMFHIQDICNYVGHFFKNSQIIQKVVLTCWYIRHKVTTKWLFYLVHIRQISPDRPTGPTFFTRLLCQSHVSHYIMLCVLMLYMCVICVLCCVI